MSAADLLRLAGEADALGTEPEPGAGPGPAGPGTPDIETPAERNMRGLCMLAEMFAMACDSPLIFDPPIRTPRQHLTDKTIPQLCAPWANVLTHYGLDPFRDIDRPEIAAAFMTGPALFALVRDLRDELRARRAKPITPEPAPADAGAAAGGP